MPVYWPILVMYFFVLFFLTMRRQIQSVTTHPMVFVVLALITPLSRHMVKYKYVPFDIGRKTRYV